jgi:DNA polymerase-3 subunit alpha
VFVTAAHAKLNLSLAITGRRADGFHELVSLVAGLELADELTFTPGPVFALTCDDPTLPVDGTNLVLGGLITNLSRKFTKKGDQMAVFVLEDLDSTIECTVFPRTLTEQGHKLLDDAIVTVKGRIDRKDDTRIGFMVQDVQIIEGLDTASAAPLRLRVPATSLTELKIHQIRKILREHPGESPVYLHIGQGKVLRLADEFCVDLDRVVGELRMALGHDAVIL